jgi:hypothetical protein
MASLSPVPVMRFFDANGLPLAGGKVYTFQAGTSIPLASYTDQTGMTPNSNPVILDSTGSAAIWLVGSYKINVKDANDVQQPNYPVDNIYDIATQIGGAFGTIQNIWGGTSGGSPNIITLNPNPALTSIPVGQTIRFKVFQDNNAGSTINVNGLGDIAIRKSNGTILVPLSEGDLKANMIAEIAYDGTQWQLTNPKTFSKSYDIASASTVNLSNANGSYVNITGNTDITSFGNSSAGTVVIITFSGSLKLTYNATSMILPGGLDIVTSPNDSAIFVSEGSGNWRLINYQKYSNNYTYNPKIVSGLTVSNNALDAINDIDFAGGIGMDSSGSLWQLSATTKRLDAIWTAGNNQGGLFSGTKANNTTYHVWLIRNSTTGAVDCGFDTSTIGANVPSGWVIVCRIASLFTLGSGQWVTFVQSEKTFRTTQLQAFNNASGGRTYSLLTLSVPIGFSVESIVQMSISITTNGTGSVGHGFNQNLSQSFNYAISGSVGFSAVAREFTNNAGQIYFGTTGSINLSFLTCYGWVDYLL